MNKWNSVREKVDRVIEEERQEGELCACSYAPVRKKRRIPVSFGTCRGPLMLLGFGKHHQPFVSCYFLIEKWEERCGELVVRLLKPVDVSGCERRGKWILVPTATCERIPVHIICSVECLDPELVRYCFSISESWCTDICFPETLAPMEKKCVWSREAGNVTVTLTLKIGQRNVTFTEKGEYAVEGLFVQISENQVRISNQSGAGKTFVVLLSICQKDEEIFHAPLRL